MSVLHVWPEPLKRSDGCVIASAVIEAPGEERKTLWYSLPIDQEKYLTTHADPFVVGAVCLMMKSGYDVHVHGRVSPSLIRNLEEYQAAWSKWVPDMKSVCIHADHMQEIADNQDRKGVIFPFSAGVDSCFTAYRHARAAGTQVPYKLTTAIMVQGFDIPLDEPETFASAVERSRKLLASLDIELIPMATNFRSLIIDWSHSFASALASCMMLFSKKFNTGLIGQGFTYDEFTLLYEGSNPLTDPLLSSDSFKIVPDGSGFDRAAKISAMRDWDEFLHHLRVCWQGDHKDRNCCICEKCTRNILTFKALGLGLPSCFPQDVEDERLKTLGFGAGSLPEIRYEKLPDLADSNGVEGKWIEIIQNRLAKRKRQRDARGIMWYRYQLRPRTRLLKWLRK